MSVRNAKAEWHGDLKSGDGRMSFGGGGFDGPFSYKSRFEEGQGTNPEELIAAAEAGCFSMALAANLSGEGHTPTRVNTVAHVHLDSTDKGPTITRIELETEAEVPGIDDAAFQKHAQHTKETCPVSRLLAGAEISVTAKLV